MDGIESGVDLSHHLAAEGGVRPVEAGRIDQHDLRIRTIHDPLNPVARGLGPRSYDGDFLAYEVIYERGFPGIWPADDGHKPGLEFLSHERCSSNSPIRIVATVLFRHET